MDTLSHPEIAAAASPLRVFIVDDVSSARAGLRAYLSLTTDIEVIGQAADGVEALEQIPVDLPDVVIMDIEMPRMDGLQATRLLRQQGLAVHIIVLSIAFDRRDEALDAGADTFIHKGEPLGKLVAVLEKFRPPPPSAARKAIKKELNPPITIIELETTLYAIPREVQ